MNKIIIGAILVVIVLNLISVKAYGVVLEGRLIYKSPHLVTVNLNCESNASDISNLIAQGYEIKATIDMGQYYTMYLSK